jgi:hypothetical protein
MESTIRVGWKEDVTTDQLNEERRKELKINVSKDQQLNKKGNILEMQEDINRDNPAKPENTAAEDYPINESGTEPSKPDNSTNIEVRASKRVKKPPATKKSDFLW